jgi:catechol 2,3-dioxygenase-like lactoylglutathione lyase family enzyme
MTKLIGSAPIILVSDIHQASAYYAEKLGFRSYTLHGDPPDFCMAWRDGLCVMLALANAADIRPHWKIVRSLWNVYFWVDDVDALYAEFLASGAIIDYAIGIKPYGVKEFGVRDLDDHDIAFGQIAPA